MQLGERLYLLVILMIFLAMDVFLLKRLSGGSGGVGAFCSLAFVMPLTLVFAWSLILHVVESFKAPLPLTLISPARVQVGETVRVTYWHKFKHVADTEHVTFKLFLRESATYQHGTDTVTVIHNYPMDEFSHPAEHYPGGGVLERSWQIQIPPASMPTFKANHNKVQWFVQVHVGIKGWVDYKHDFEIYVLP